VFKCISIEEASTILDTGRVQLADVRDDASYNAAHIPGATLVSNTTVQNFLAQSDPNITTIVYCYHGIASQSAAAYLSEKGFREVYSLEGGFEAWRTIYPTTS